MDRTGDQYIGWRTPLPEPVLDRTAALLVVDMQYFDAHPDYGACARARERGISLDYYTGRLKVIVPNIRRLQEVDFRTS